MEMDVVVGYKQRVREMHWFLSFSPLVVQQNTRAKKTVKHFTS